MPNKKKSVQRGRPPGITAKRLTPWERQFEKEEAARKAVAAQKRKEIKAKKQLIAQLEATYGVKLVELGLEYGEFSRLSHSDFEYEFECLSKAKKGQLIADPDQAHGRFCQGWGEYGWFQEIAVGYCSTMTFKQYCQKFDLDKAVDRLSKLRIIDCVAILYLLEKNPDKLKAICDANLETAKLQFHQLLNDFVWKS